MRGGDASRALAARGFVPHEAVGRAVRVELRAGEAGQARFGALLGVEFFDGHAVEAHDGDEAEKVTYQSPSIGSTCTACASSAGKATSGGSFLPQQDTSASPVVTITLPQAGQTRNAARFMVPPVRASTARRPSSSVSTGVPKRSDRPGKSSTSGQPPPRSHLDTALPVTPSGVHDTRAPRPAQ